MKRTIVFTDLDGTLLDYSTYSFDKAFPALNALKRKDIPLVICSSKTRKEIEYYRKKLDNHDPFIPENGGGVFIPRGYFPDDVIEGAGCASYEDSYDVIRLGVQYTELRQALSELRTEGFKVKGFGDLTTEEVAELTGMSFVEAAMAKARNFDEPFIIVGGQDEVNRLKDAIAKKGFRLTRGRFFHILGNTDKGKAVSILTEFYRRTMGDVITVAIGDGPNDLPMLKVADIPVIVQKKDGKYDPEVELPRMVRAKGIGPVGWNRAVNNIIRSA